MTEAFSRQALQQAGPGEVAPTLQLEASDGIQLAFRRYRPEHPIAVLIFHHGGGAHSGAGYAHLAAGIRDAANVAVITPDLRGHGASEGERGDAPSGEQMWRDVASFVRFARSEYPGLPVFVGGHSSGAGLALNYAAWAGREPVDGYVFLSPQLGFRSKTDRVPDKNSTAFADVAILPFIVHAITRGAWMGHKKAVHFRYPADILAEDPGMVSSYTVNAANGVTPQAPADQFADLDRPFGLWVGGHDEFFVPEAVTKFGQLAERVRRHSIAAIVPEQTHLGILIEAHQVIAPWLAKRAA